MELCPICTSHGKVAEYIVCDAGFRSSHQICPLSSFRSLVSHVCLCVLYEKLPRNALFERSVTPASPLI